MSRQTNGNINLSWKTASYFDYWSIVHFLAGVTIGSGVIVFGWSDAWSFIFLLALLFSWELFERMIHKGEPLIGVVMDVIYGVSGYVIIKIINPQSRTALIVGLIALSLQLTGNLIGWRHSNKPRK